MAIQNRRGYEADFDPAKMLPGEWAVSLDTKYVRMCFAPGECLRMATYEGFEQDMEEVRRILTECKTIEEAVKRVNTEVSANAKAVEEYTEQAKTYMESASTSASIAKSSETNAKTSETNAKASENNAKVSEQNAQRVFESLPEDYSELSEEVGKLSSEIEELQNATMEVVPIIEGYENGYVDYKGDKAETTALKCIEFECKYGDIFYYTGKLLGSAKVARSAFFNDETFVNYDVISSTEPVLYENEKIVIPKGINKVIFSAYTFDGVPFVIKHNKYKDIPNRGDIKNYFHSTSKDFMGHNPIPKCDTDFLQFICYGQSLSNGSDSLFVSDDVVEKCYMLGSVSEPTTTLNPLRLTTNSQHPIVSAINSFATLFHSFVDKNTNFIAGSYGAGGQSIAQLMSATRQAEIKAEENYNYDISTSGKYQIFLNSLTKGKEVANSCGKSITCPAIVFLQGERDYYTDESLSTQSGRAVNAYACGGDKGKYKLYMSRLKEDMQNAVMETYGQTEKPLFLIYQCNGGFVKNKEMSINMAQIEFAEENEDVILLQSPYALPHYSSSHMSTNGYRWYGEFIAKALFQTLVLHSEYKPILPTNFIVDNDSIKFKIANAVLPLVNDTNLAQSISKLGFCVYADNVEVTITSFRFYGDEIILYLEKSISNANKIEISYAGMERGGIGTVRDSDSYKAMYEYWNDTNDKGSSGNLTINHRPTDENGNVIVGKKYPMYSWLQSFYYKIKG